MERLVSPKVLEASISLHYDAYLKGLLWLDYFTTVLAGQTDVLGNLRFIKEEMKKKSEKTSRPWSSCPHCNRCLGSQSR